VFVSCDHCFAEYELDDAKIPAGGARLRCKNCDQTFVIVPSETSDLQSAGDLAHDALAAEVPDEADLDPERGSALEENFDLDGDSERGSSVEEDFDPDGESDWEFNDQVENSEPEVDEEASESAFEQDGDWVDLSAAEDVVDDLLESSGAIETDAAAAVDDLLGEIDTDAAAAVDDPLGEVDTADSQLGESGGDLTSGSEFPSKRLDLGDAEAFDGSGGDPATDGGNSFDDPSKWDLFDQPAEIDASAASAGLESPPVSAARDGARAEPRVELSVAMADNVRATARWTDRISEIVGWGVVILMMITALVAGLTSKSSDARAPAGSWSGAGFEADQIVGRWVDNAIAGSIYVVSGRIRGAPGSDRASQKSLGIRLFDTAGREIDRAPIPLGPAVPERILRESSPAKLDAFQARRAGRIAAVSTRWVSFEAVLTDLPRFAGRFELQALDH
jgi:predicted Zn finger-like uncharacterized protein